MSERKNIDRLFQEKFKDFEVSPPDRVWKGIEAKLKEEEEDRKILPFWFRLAGVAAALLIGWLLFDGGGITGGNGDTNDPVVVVEGNGISTNSAQPNQNGTTIEAHGAADSTAAGNRRNDNLKEAIELKPIKENNYETGVATYNGNRREKSAGSESNRNPAYRNQTQRSPATLSNPTRSEAPFANRDGNRAVATSGNRKNQSEPDSDASLKSHNVTRAVATSENRNEGSASPEKNTVGSNRLANSGSDQQNKNLTPQGGQIVQQEKTSENQKTTIDPDKNILLEDKLAAQLPDDKKTDTTAIATVVPNTLEELLKEKENKTVTKDEPKLNRWQISSNVAPIYFSSTSNDSPIDSRLTESGKEYKADLTYGVGVRYAVNNKFTIRAGVNTIGMEYVTNDLAFVQTPNARTLENVKPNIRGSLIQIEGKAAGLNNMLTSVAPTSGRKFSSKLNQRTGYIEVPLEMSYKLLDRKFGIEVIGGVSTLFLNENSISLIASGMEMEIGKANNLNATHFSTNLGLGLRYNFMRNFQFNLEPMFKYQINTFSNSASFNPYIFGLYTGINYKF
ncbi:MAG TPA: outer membrane beta-barrel protein [Flavobacterium sp.]|jgi:hypothetical protein